MFCGTNLRKTNEILRKSDLCWSWAENWMKRERLKILARKVQENVIDHLESGTVLYKFEPSSEN